jgi:hypothetical protein
MRSNASAASVVLVAILAAGQGRAPVLTDRRAISAEDVAAVFRAARRAIADRPFRLVAGAFAGGPEFQFDSDGALEFARNWDPDPVLTEYTRTPARRCDGSPLAGQLVIEFSTRRGVPVARARASRAVEQPYAYAVRALLASDGFSDAGLSATGERAFSAPWTPPGGTYAADVSGAQTLWLDAATLLPRRLEVTLHAPLGGATPERVPIVYDVQFDPSITFRAPPDIPRPTCVQ